MATDLETINSFLAAAEVTTKWALAIQGKCNELSRLTALVEAKSEELAEKERRISEIDDQVIKSGAELRRAQELLAAQTEKNSDELGRQQNQLRTAEKRLKEVQSQLENAVSGLRALKERIG
jgi:chromosome segregation ATPase